MIDSTTSTSAGLFFLMRESHDEHRAMRLRAVFVPLLPGFGNVAACGSRPIKGWQRTHEAIENEFQPRTSSNRERVPIGNEFQSRTSSNRNEFQSGTSSNRERVPIGNEFH